MDQAANQAIADILKGEATALRETQQVDTMPCAVLHAALGVHNRWNSPTWQPRKVAAQLLGHSGLGIATVASIQGCFVA